MREQPMPKYPIDFKDLKERATFEPILAHYQLAYRIRGDQAVLRCPFHNDTEPSLSINLREKIWQCFGCRAKGNILDFMALKENTPLPKAAALIDEICHLGLTMNDPARRATMPVDESKRAKTGKGRSTRSKPPAEAPASSGDAINPPLTFTLKLDPNHPYLEERRVSPAERQAFGLGYCDRGMMKGRICIPIHN